MKISIIIPTYNGAHKILNCLESLEGQTFQDFEIIVVVDGSTDKTIEILDSQKFDFNELIIEKRVNGGRSIARNHGARVSTGDLLIFLDDDMRVSNSFIESHYKFHEKHGGILVGSQIEDDSKVQNDFQRFKLHLSQKWMSDLGKGLVKIESTFITAANCSIKKNVFNKLKRFDEDLTDAEDYDLAVKAKSENVDVYFDSNIVAWHDDFITCVSYMKRLKEYKKAHLKLVELYPERHSIEMVTIEKNIFKTIVFGLFSFTFWQKVIDGNRLFFLPRKIRFKIYDWVVTAQSVYFA